ncbi:helix-turn-helix domain-containing protein [Streptomyces albidoflavus]|jgi:transcriptional regulator with XRE-family HTH domain|uniref:Helix-turn-helix transcriptional regulator n=2 Tax=Streptomyces TaxID=1883 RepID=A0ACC7Y4C1_9ACTN|nr:MULTISPECIES: XRE family transcriptional regulator [Streptomyces]MBF4137955.1 cupin domain-containing protein [Streptomyces albidoflavus]MBV7652852.1 XRE family transcriptional regulator [Streptomyces albidoflavus]MBV7708358.1 XRE family transcriptional regulator [Streptomyces albidoflavus]MCU7703846.1 XRE family transcriptional regulator [Streptomyces albidoflavus]NUV76824.1 helix-turn-helix transcriptional regulator [Streptomyces fungicidicus]
MSPRAHRPALPEPAPPPADTDTVLAGVGPRLRALRKERGATLAGLSAATGISVSTLSRLESGNRRPSLELLLPIAAAHDVPLDRLVGAPPAGDPRVRLEPIEQGNRTVIPLSRRPGGLQAFKWVLRPGEGCDPVEEQRTHEGYEWLYVISGRLRLLLGEHDFELGEGEAAEFDTRLPHWFGAIGDHPAEVLSLFGPQGERMHVRARPKSAR